MDQPYLQSFLESTDFNGRDEDQSFLELIGFNRPNPPEFHPAPILQVVDRAEGRRRRRRSYFTPEMKEWIMELYREYDTPHRRVYEVARSIFHHVQGDVR